MKKLYGIINILLSTLLVYLIVGAYKIITEPDTTEIMPLKSTANFDLKQVENLNPPEMPDTLILNDFETQNDLYNLRNIEKNLDIKFNRTNGKHMVKARPRQRLKLKNTLNLVCAIFRPGGMIMTL